MKYLLLLISIVSSLATRGQEFEPDWYILERGSSLAIMFAGAVDVMQVKQGEKLRERLDKVQFYPGEVVLLFEKHDNAYTGMDHAGRMLYVKGPVTRVSHPEGSSLALTKEMLILQEQNIMVPNSAFIWILGGDAFRGMMTIQYAGGKNLGIPPQYLVHYNQISSENVKQVKFYEAQ